MSDFQQRLVETVMKHVRRSASGPAARRRWVHTRMDKMERDPTAAGDHQTLKAAYHKKFPQHKKEFAKHVGSFFGESVDEDGEQLDEGLKKKAASYISGDDDKKNIPWHIVADRAEEDGRGDLAKEIRTKKKIKNKLAIRIR